LQADKTISYLILLLSDCFEDSNIDYVGNHGPRHAPRGAPEVVPVNIPGKGLVFTMHLDEKYPRKLSKRLAMSRRADLAVSIVYRFVCSGNNKVSTSTMSLLNSQNCPSTKEPVVVFLSGKYSSHAPNIGKVTQFDDSSKLKKHLEKIAALQQRLRNAQHALIAMPVLQLSCSYASH
jgi:hypothetical protein